MSFGLEEVISVCQEQQKKSAAVVTHGGVIMNLMETVTAFEKSFYEWHVKNLCGYSIYIEKELEKNGKLDLPAVLTGFLMDLCIGDPRWMYHPSV